MLSLAEKGGAGRVGHASSGADVLLQLDAFPERSSEAEIGAAVLACAELGASVCAVVNRPSLGLHANLVGEALAGLESLAETETSRAEAAVKQVVAAFRSACRKAGVPHRHLVVHEPITRFPDRVAQMARTHDLCLVPYSDPVDGQRAIAEAVVFGSGRPVLIWQGARPFAPAKSRSVVIAWDGGRSAARAVADALPLMAGASHVAIAALGSEDRDNGSPAEVLAGYLAHHRVHAEIVRPDAILGGAEAMMLDILERSRADLMVLGASRSAAFESLFGGLAERVLTRPPTVVLMSH